jgi:hypothetical protein
LNALEETFRHPNLFVETIRDIQQKQEESLNEIQSKLAEMNQVNDHLEATNKFKPNLSSFNQVEDMSLFGSIRLFGFTNTKSFKSHILKDEQQSLELIKLCEFSPNDKWSLLYRGTRDGFTGRDFHSKCDGHSNTLTILKAKENKLVFWESSFTYKSDSNAFIFSLTNKDNGSIIRWFCL